MGGRPLILTVGRNGRNLDLLGEFLAKAGFDARPADSLEGLDAALEEGADFALALVDLTGFDSSIWERCERLRREGIPFLVLSPRQSAAVEREGLSRGARGVLVKPLAVQELLRLVRVLAEKDEG